MKPIHRTLAGSSRSRRSWGWPGKFGENDCRGGCFAPLVNFVYSF